MQWVSCIVLYSRAMNWTLRKAFLAPQQCAGPGHCFLACHEESLYKLWRLANSCAETHELQLHLKASQALEGAFHAENVLARPRANTTAVKRGVMHAAACGGRLLAASCTYTAACILRRPTAGHRRITKFCGCMQVRW